MYMYVAYMYVIDIERKLEHSSKSSRRYQGTINLSYQSTINLSYQGTINLSYQGTINLTYTGLDRYLWRLCQPVSQHIE